jgi:hypothetical protein
MGNLAAWLLGLATPLVKKGMLALGLGTLSYAALTPLVNSVIQHAQSNYGQITGAVAQLVGLAGLPEVLGIYAGALTARVAFIAVGQIGKVA